MLAIDTLAAPALAAADPRPEIEQVLATDTLTAAAAAPAVIHPF